MLYIHITISPVVGYLYNIPPAQQAHCVNMSNWPEQISPVATHAAYSYNNIPKGRLTTQGTTCIAN